MELSNRTVYGKARTVLAELRTICTLESYRSSWPEALRCVVYVYNRTLTRSTHKDARDKTPYQLITREKPDLSYLRSFGPHAKVLKPKKYREGKVESKVWDAIHVGYDSSGAYRAYVPDLRRVFVSRDVTFVEKLPRRRPAATFDMDETNETLPDDHEDNYAERSDCDDEPSGLYAPEKGTKSSNRAGRMTETDTPIEIKTKSGRAVRTPQRYAHLAFLTAEAMCGNTDHKDEDVPEKAENATKGAHGHYWTPSMLEGTAISRRGKRVHSSDQAT